MQYVLENHGEFKRLEKQSSSKSYDIATELESVLNLDPRKVLDAGCGSGIVSRFLAAHFPKAEVTGCDFSPERVEQARGAAHEHRNLSFSPEDLKKLSFKKGAFDLIVCRYVLQHFERAPLKTALSELQRCLAPGGTFCAIDIDGGFHNLYPMPPLVAKVLQAMDQSGKVDLRVGRKLPSLLLGAGFEKVSCEVQTLLFQAGTPEMREERVLIEERFNGAMGFFAQVAQSEKKAERFRDAYLKALDEEGTVMFFNKFVVRAQKARTLKLVSR
jgi:SAM-dependent methyltransferase